LDGAAVTDIIVAQRAATEPRRRKKGKEVIAKRLFGLMAASALVAACDPAPAPPADVQAYDVLIVDGTVFDGSGEPSRNVNIGIAGGRIESMRASADAAAEYVIDATGMIVVPGFIDPHTHADDDIFERPGNRNTNYLAQGVTTVFIGNDGGGVVDRESRMQALAAIGVGTNVAWFSGHGAAREHAMGLEDRAPTDEEMRTMLGFVEADMRAGALGLSTGLFYRPGSYAGTEEVIELARVAARYGGVYDSHLRDESSYNIGLLGAVAEAIRIGEEADIPVHIAHLKALGTDLWGRSGDVIGMVSAARERGVDVTADQYPYRASGTRLASSLIPRWVMADSEDAMFRRLDNADLRDRIREEMAANLVRRGGADSLLVTGDSEWRGRTLGEIAVEMGVDPLEAAIAVVRGGNPSVASFNMNPDDINAIAIQPWVMTGSDGSTGHPRKYATFPKAYRDLVSDGSLMPMSEFVHRSSGRVADWYGLCNRGYLREGRQADIAVIDPASYRPVADFENPTALATGVRHLLVNGRPAIAAGKMNSGQFGEIIDKQALRCAE
jgi:N-acyl-D-aspartate/D-glutamate deacylase